MSERGQFSHAFGYYFYEFYSVSPEYCGFFPRISACIGKDFVTERNEGGQE
jgi:hypothetical protein